MRIAIALRAACVTGKRRMRCICAKALALYLGVGVLPAGQSGRLEERADTCLNISSD